jgi:hypothetical protein
MGKRVMKFKIFCAVVFFALAAEPAAARQRQVTPAEQPAISTYCATIEPGNPFSKVYDYQAWSAWRARGLWDSTGSDRCARNPLYSPPGTPTFRPIPFPNPSWF